MKTPLLLLLPLLAASLLPPVSAQNSDRPAERGEFRELRERLRNLPPEEREAMLRELRERFRDLPPEQRQERLRQFRDQAGRPGDAPPPGGPGAMPARGGGLERFLTVLTPEQRESLRAHSAEHRDRVQALETRLANARKDALIAGLAPEFNEPALREKYEAIGKLEAELAVLRARAFARVEPPLTAEQIERIKNLPPPGEALRERWGRGPAGEPRPPGDRPPRRGGDGPRDEHGLPMPAPTR